MLIGVPKEIKNHEYRTGLTPASVRELTARGHTVVVQADLGGAIGLTDEQYAAAGARIAADAREIFGHGRTDRQGEGAPAGRTRDARGPARCCSPTCTWRRIPGRPRTW